MLLAGFITVEPLDEFSSSLWPHWSTRSLQKLPISSSSTRQLHQREFVSMISLGSLGSLKMGFTSFSPIILHSLIFVWCTTYSHGHPLPLKKDYYWPWWPPSSRSIPGGVFLNFQLQGTLQHSKFRSSMGLEYARNCLWMWMWLVCHLRSVIWFSSSSVCKTWGGGWVFLKLR